MYRWLVLPHSPSKESLASESVASDFDIVPLRPMRVLSFFSGAMGLDQGLERAGMQTILACEFDRASRQTIAHNRPELPLLGDIWDYSAAEIRDLAGLGDDEDIDVVAGGPPCQSFSTAGARRGFADKRGNVFLRFIELIGELQPRYAILENVRGLLSMPIAAAEQGEPVDPLAADLAGKRGGALTYATRLLKSHGYDVSFNLYNTANYGSAQIRERVVLICSRSTGRVPHLPPTHSNDPAFDLPPWRTFREATEGLEHVNHHHVEFPEARLKYYRLLTSGQHWRHLPVDLQKEALGKSYYLGGGKTGFLRRLSWDKPAPTLVTNPTMPATDLAHPDLDRPLSIEEYKRVQEFPDSWQIQGKLQDQYKQVGNAVPLSLGEAIGKAIQMHDAGQIWNELPNFPYSLYRKTSDLSWIEDEDVPIKRAAPSNSDNSELVV
jgi:DNA (cytosine-5)-methyltransferase 1